MYLTGGYISKYSVAEKIKKSTALILYFVMATIMFLSRPIMNVLTRKVFGKVLYEDLFISYNTALVILASLGLFVFCVKLSFSERTKKVIGFFSPAALGVYLIHYHPNVITDVIKKALPDLDAINIFLVPVFVFAFALVIYVVCSLIEKARICLFKLLRINSLFVKFENLTDCIYEKVYNKLNANKAVE
jgi:surface polysaccharide O-acyltransferase-like enzyme